MQMYEQRLMSIGFPYSEACSICNSIDRDTHNIEAFVLEQEKLYRNDKEDQSNGF